MDFAALIISFAELETCHVTEFAFDVTKIPFQKHMVKNLKKQSCF